MATIRHIVHHAPRFVALASLLAPLLGSPRAAAQATAGVEKPQPNVLLLVDTSGSMELKADGTYPTCNALSPGLTNQKNRWIDLIEVLTGTFANYSCWKQDRNSAAFRSEFTLGGISPYDYGYTIPYTRALSSSCLYGPGVVPPTNDPYSFPARAVNTFTFTGTSVTRPADLANHPGCAGFAQATDGLLDIYNNQLRFGLMTFDGHVNSGTGVSAGVANYTTGNDGNWSYYLGAPAAGHPTNCPADMEQEVGARNAAAPPWEGRMVAFGDPNATNNTQRNTWIQQVLLSTRPYGATPIAGLLTDAQNFLWNDLSTDPLDQSGSPKPFGPSNDPNWRAPNCRKTIAILLTDGEPNLDLRPFCDAATTPPDTPGHCPYDKSENIVSALRLDPPTPSLAVETYVIGFGLGNVTLDSGPTVSCSALTDAQCAANASNKPVQACCTLNKIAAAGGVDENNQPRRAFFADDRDQLRSIFTEILDDVVQVTTRTIPIFSGAGGDSSSAGFKFFSAFDPRPDPSSVSLWKGVLQRKRFVCNDDLEPIEEFSEQKGDDFAANLASGSGPARKFYTVVNEASSRLTVRPRLLTTTDGLGIASGTLVTGSSATLPTQIPAVKMEVTGATCSGGVDADTCRTRIVSHLLGVSLPGQPTRCPSSTQCNLLGGVYHSTPQVVPGRPADFLRDESYSAFIDLMLADERPSVMYTSTVDGMLHAFKLAPYPGQGGDVETLANNELWAFMPPAVLPALQAQYPATPALLLDGTPVIKDVVARVDNGVESFERLQADANSGVGAWRTVLVQGFGDGQVSGGYFALDVTKPESDGPKFLWQLTRTAGGADLFGSGGTPLITTLFIDAAGGPREVAVAVLPGGSADPVVGQQDTAIGTVMRTEPSAPFQSTRAVQLYTGGERARSLTIVRLDNGQVIRTFRPAGSSAAFNSGVVTDTVIPSPIVGQPKSFPPDTGSVADRIFVGDKDGRIWRVDVSSTNPADWTMKVFFDAFYDMTASDGQPVEIPPVLSVNDTGNITIAFATGDQRATAGSSTLENRVISLTEKLDNDEFIARVNWVQKLSNAERVTGPMALFDKGLYYAASRPPNTTSSRCDVGASNVYASHYEQNRAQQLAQPDSAISGPAFVKPFTSNTVVTRTDGMIFGVSLEAEPSCSSVAETASADESFGYGSVQTSRTVKPGRFFIAYQVNGTTQGANGVDEQQISLGTPRVPVTFESWALIYE
jgi:type IV pilus assembly protein PilY1